jgi:hypothetical protein
MSFGAHSPPSAVEAVPAAIDQVARIFRPDDTGSGGLVTG